MKSLTHFENRDLEQAAGKCFSGAKLIASERMKGGVSADVYRLDLLLTDGSKQKVVLRCLGATHCGHDAELEFGLLEALHAAGTSVPKPLSFDTSCTFLEHPYLIIDFIDGSSVIERSRLGPSIETMVEELILVHGVQTETVPILPLRVDPRPDLLEFLPKGTEWHEFRKHLQKLKNTSFEGAPVLLHGDYWPSNLIWRDGRIAAILDWEDAALGDPLSDVACACLELRYIYGETGKDLFEKAYAQRRSLDKERLMLWLAYVSSAALKQMAGWGLECTREAHMRQTAHATLKEAAASLL